MKLVWEGRELAAVQSINDARIDVIMELQKQTGWGMQKLNEMGKNFDVLGAPITVFLTLHSAGIPVKWKWLTQQPLGALASGIELEPGDRGYEAWSAERAREDGGEAENTPTRTPDVALAAVKS